MSDAEPTFDPRLLAALTLQLRSWRATLAAGAGRIGWKLGVGDRERIGAGPVIGHLTTATQLAPGTVHAPLGVRSLHADVEVAVELGEYVAPGSTTERARAAIAAYGVALELVDLGDVAGGAEAIVANNVFHHAFAFGPLEASAITTAARGRLIVNGRVIAEARVSSDAAELVRTTADLLAAVGERLRAGDRLITGAVVQVPVAAGDEVVAAIDALGDVGLTIASAA